MYRFRFTLPGLLLAGLALAQSDGQWVGPDLTLSIDNGTVVSAATVISVNCTKGIDTSMVTVHGKAAVASQAFKFSGEAPTVCGPVQILVEGRLAGSTASGSLTATPPKDVRLSIPEKPL